MIWRRSARPLRRIPIVGAALALAGWVVAVAQVPGLGSPAHAAVTGEPAVIVQPTAASRRELEKVVRQALGGAPAALGDDALTASSTLSLEHGRARDPAGLPLNGRDVSRPDNFALFKRGSRCVLVHLRDGHAWRLHHTDCAAIKRGTGTAPPAMSANQSPKIM